MRPCPRPISGLPQGQRIRLVSSATAQPKRQHRARCCGTTEAVNWRALDGVDTISEQQAAIDERLLLMYPDGVMGTRVMM